MTQLKEIQIALEKATSKHNPDFIHTIIPGEIKMRGIKMPLINELAKTYKAAGFDLAPSLWQTGWHEERLIAVKMLESQGKKDPVKLFSLFKKFANDIDNWAICDAMGMQMLRGIVKTHRNEIFALAENYIKDKNPWKRRLALVMVEWYTRHAAEYAAIRSLMVQVEKDDAYYVKKALTWLQRNFEKKK